MRANYTRATRGEPVPFDRLRRHLLPSIAGSVQLLTMREERGRIAGNITISEPYELWGSLSGTMTITAGGKVYVRGAIYGDLIVQDGGRCHVFGNVSGSLFVHAGAKVIHSGVVGKDVTNDGGRLVVDATAKVMGRIKTRSGETKLEGTHKES